MSLSRHLTYFFIFFFLSYSSYSFLYAEETVNTKKNTSSKSTILSSATSTVSTTSTFQEPSSKNEIKSQNITTTSKKPSQQTVSLSQKEKNKIRIQKKIDKLNQRLEKNPNNLNLHFLLGKYYYLLKDFDKAVFHLKKNSKDPSIKGLILLSKAFSQQKNYQEEIRVLNFLLDIHSSSPKLYTDIATAYYKDKKIEKAIEYYKTALQKDRRYKEAYKGLWTVFEFQENFYDMKQILVDFLAIYPNDIEGHSKLCQANLKSRFADESMQSCSRAIKVNPSYPNNHIYLGLAHKWNGNDRQAEKIIFDTAKKFRRSLLAQYEAGLLSEEKKQWESALDFYRNCVKIDNRSLICIMKTAHLEIKLGKYEESTETFLSACRINKFKAFAEIRDVAGKLRTEKKMKWYYHFKTVAERCHIVGERRLEETPYEPLANLIIEEATPEEFEEPALEDSSKKSSSKSTKKKAGETKK